MTNIRLKKKNATQLNQQIFHFQYYSHTHTVYKFKVLKF